MRLHHLATAILIPGLALAPAQTPETTAPTLKVYSRETIVDVNVTDSKSNPVHGLVKQDFTLKEDNKPQPIKSFEEFGAALPPTTVPPRLPPNVYTNLQPPPASSAVNILLLDFVNTATDVTHRVLNQPQLRIRSEAIEAQFRVKEAATKYLSTMPAGTRASIIGMSWPDKVRILQGVTSDPRLLSASVNTLGEDVSEGAGPYEQWCVQQDTKNRMTLEVLDQIAADAALIKGRKNLIWFTVGSPSVTNPDSRLPCLPDYATDLARTYARLTAAEVALYPIDARGVVPPPHEILQLSGPPLGQAMTAFAAGISAQELSMESLAEATGGKAYYNSNDLATGIARAVAIGSDYYSLSYVPPGTKYDGRYHKIKIDIDRPALQLIYRKGYAAEDPTIHAIPASLSLVASTTPATGPIDMRAAMGRSMPTSQQLLFDVQVEPSTEPAKSTDPPVFGMLDPRLKDKPLTRYGFQFAFPARQIAFTEAAGGNRIGALEFDLAAYDSDGKLVTSLGQSIKLPLTADQVQQLAKSPFRFFQQLDLPSGQLFLRIGVLDRTSNKAGTLEIPLTVPKH